MAVPAPTAADPARGIAWLAEQLANNTRPTVLTVPAPLAPAERLVTAAGDDTVVVWETPDGNVYAGVGVAAEATAQGTGRFDAVKTQAIEIFSSLSLRSQGDGAPSPRLIGGFAFAPGSADVAPWQGFGDARFWLPRFAYSKTGDRAWFSLALNGHETTEIRKGLAQRAGRLLEGLNSEASHGEAPSRVPTAFTGDDAHLWCKSVERILRAIDQGQCKKVVTARRQELRFDEALSPLEALYTLSKTSFSCTRFAFRTTGSTFLGATPERLIQKQGLNLVTEALAGSTRSGDQQLAADLRNSQKESEEHGHVVSAIVGSLGSRCSQLTYPEAPEFRELRDILHLRTPIAGELAQPTHILELVDELHPTPAVGGVPTPVAMTWISENEQSARGWYAAPVGWFDAEGDGEFVVALRSGVVEERCAHLYAGAGIVRGSLPENEFRETQLKLGALLAALGVKTES